MPVQSTKKQDEQAEACSETCGNFHGVFPDNVATAVCSPVLLNTFAGKISANENLCFLHLSVTAGREIYIDDKMEFGWDRGDRKQSQYGKVAHSAAGRAKTYFTEYC
ncbi:hypothetical protein DSJ_13365 [Pantoea stewartii subsp. stewartii DC283]|uniref:Uncharacterized protein n=1 Tax=Pantoea stewartii subsp. stewartii DC283 TaxID=660596 RepID=A0ABN4Z4W4_PANSE|nr:hypothetical protein DSJ_13365 [Pantoea stewartii subsp. stewartii DC283]